VNWRSDPLISPFRGRPVPLSSTVLLGTRQVSLPNGVSFRPMSLATCTGITDEIHTDGQTMLCHCVSIGGIVFSNANVCVCVNVYVCC